MIWNWKRILTRAWSIRLIVLAGLLTGLEVALPYLPIAMPPAWFGTASLVTSALATIARITAQRDMDDDR